MTVQVIVLSIRDDLVTVHATVLATVAAEVTVQATVATVHVTVTANDHAMPSDSQH